MTTYNLKFDGQITGKFENISQGKLVHLLCTACSKAKGSLDKNAMNEQMNMYNKHTNNGATLVLPFAKPYVKYEFYAKIVFNHK